MIIDNDMMIIWLGGDKGFATQPVWAAADDYFIDKQHDQKEKESEE